MKTLVLLQQDLRLHDNPALDGAAKRGAVIPVYILDESDPIGAASRWWLHYSLVALQAQLSARGITLILRRGNIEKIILELVQSYKADAVYWNRCYEPPRIETLKKLKTALQEQSLEAKSFKANLLFDPWEVTNKQGGIYKVFTPFWKQCLMQIPSEEALAIPVMKPNATAIHTDDLNDWQLLPFSPDWSKGLQERWTPGEEGAYRRLDFFIEHHLAGYAKGRDIPADNGTSYLSPHLHFGEISPRQIYNRIQMQQQHAGASAKFLSELGWREFSYYLLYHFPTLAKLPFNSKFTEFPWVDDGESLIKWQKGLTGYPIVDAGMRELWHTGYMHNRVRMITASFLTKDLRIHWLEGAAWFFDTLVDADLANNSASWQWVAGSGADASPYYRIFNPMLQGQRFDPEGAYVKRWIPELSKLPASAIHNPWEADSATLARAGVVLGKTYPLPMVNHAKARDIALDLYKNIGKAS
jgi:deoxyribodipyrimidine photo-lyase